MKVACAAWGFREMGLREFFRAARGLGIEFVEVNCSGSVPKHLMPSSSVEEARGASELARSEGVRVVAIAAGNDFTLAEEERWRGEVERVKRVVDLAEAAGAEVVRVFAGWAKEPGEEVMRRAARGIREVAEYAAPKGILVAVEINGGITATGELCAKLLEMAGDLPNLGLNYDPANFAHVGEDPLRALEAVGERVVYCHLKDVRPGPEGRPEYCALGEGEIDWAPIFDRLKGFYRGYLAIEYERAEDVVEGTRRSLENLRKFLEV